MKFKVQLHADCIAHGGREVYPDGKVGTEVPPVIEREADETAEAFKLRQASEYQTSGARTEERLRHISFPNLGSMWIPEWLLVPVIEPTPLAS